MKRRHFLLGQSTWPTGLPLPSNGRWPCYCPPEKPSRPEPRRVAVKKIDLAAIFNKEWSKR